ncbi:hypothetical protein D9M69_296680 [compost metagenome]
MRLVVEAQVQGDFAQVLAAQYPWQGPLQAQLGQPLVGRQPALAVEAPQCLPGAEVAEGGQFLQRGRRIQARLQPFPQARPGAGIEALLRLADAQGGALRQQVGQGRPELALLLQRRSLGQRGVQLLQLSAQGGVAQDAGGQARRALAVVAEAAAGVVQPLRIEGQHAELVALPVDAGAVVDLFRRHQQHIPGVSLVAFTLVQVALPAAHQQPQVVLQVEVPGEAEVLILGVDQADAGQAAGDVVGLVHGRHFTPWRDGVLGQNCGWRRWKSTMGREANSL